MREVTQFERWLLGLLHTDSIGLMGHGGMEYNDFEEAIEK